MNLTTEQTQALLSLLLGTKSAEQKETPAKKQHLAEKYIGQYVLVRGTSQNGVFAGYLESVDADGAILKHCRRLWYWKVEEGKGDFLEAIAMHGVAKESKLSEAVPEQVLNGWCQIYQCSREATTSIKHARVHNG